MFRKENKNFANFFFCKFKFSDEGIIVFFFGVKPKVFFFYAFLRITLLKINILKKSLIASIGACYNNVIKKKVENGKYNYNSSKFIKSKAKIRQFDRSL
jgi:nucleoside permease NupC